MADGARGASAQRNAAVRALPDDVDVVVFLDDDSVPRSDYLERAVAVLETNPDVIGLTGRVARDGVVERRSLTGEEISAALESSWADPGTTLTDIDRLYGTNMVVRAAAVRAVPFDERLPLYSWLEDLDFSRRLLRRGRLVQTMEAVIVHQGNDNGGRTQHRRVGYSQVANFLYLRQKGSLTTREATHLVGRPLLRTLVGSIVGPERVDRRERLRGMGLAAFDAARGRITPERIVDL